MRGGKGGYIRECGHCVEARLRYSPRDPEGEGTVQIVRSLGQATLDELDLYYGRIDLRLASVYPLTIS
eukprot:9307701-Pyramimonas_sp.AAC.1